MERAKWNGPNGTGMTDKGSMGEQLEERPPPSGGESALVAKTMAGAAWLLTWKMVARSLGFISTLVLARVLAPGDFGVLAMAGTFAAAVDALSQLGLQDALVRHVGNDRRLFNTAFTLQVGRAVIISTFVAGMAPVAVWWFGEPRLAPILYVLAGSSLLGGAENIGLVEVRRAMRFDVQFKLMLTARLVQLATTIPLALLLRSYWALLLGIVASQEARLIMATCSTRFGHAFNSADGVSLPASLFGPGRLLRPASFGIVPIRSCLVLWSGRPN